MEPKFSPDGFFLYYFSDQQIESEAGSPYGARGGEPSYLGTQQLMCLPLREGFKCPFFMGDELNVAGQIFDPAVGKQIATCLLYTSPSPRDLSTSRMPSSA